MTAVRTAHPPMLTRDHVIAVLRARHAREYAKVIDTLLRGGIRTIELTLSTEGAVEHLPEIIRGLESDAEIGIGTVTSREQAVAAIEAGAAFIVTPVISREVIEICTAASVPVYPGGLTPTELHHGWTMGASAVKVFPASMVGPEYVAHLRGPFPDIEVVPSGGVDRIAAIEWIRAGASAVSIGGPLIGDAFAGGDLAALAERAHRLGDEVRQAAADRAPR